MNRLFSLARTLHAWTGAALSLLLVLVALTGALLVWKDDYLRLVFPGAREALAPTPAALARVAGAAEEAFGADELLVIYFGDERMGLSRIRTVDDVFAYLDPEGRVVATWEMGGRPEDWLLELHHRLLVKTPGLYVVGFAGLATSVLVILGLLAFWPARRSLMMGPQLRGTGRRELLLSHRNIGILTAPLVLLAVLTGAALAFPDTSRALLMKRLEHDETYGETFDDDMDSLSGPEVAGWLPALERAQAAFPGARIRTATWPAATPPYRVIRLQQQGGWNPQGDTLVYVDAYEGWMDLRIDARTLPPEERLNNALYPLHTAGLGRLWDVVTFVTGLAVAALGVLGFWAFARRWARPR